MARIDEVTEELRAKPRRWLVTGAAGFIGSHLVETLLELGQTVVGLDNLFTGRKENILEVSAGHPKERFTFVEGDIRSVETCVTVAHGMDVVLHQAALGSVPRSLEDPRTTHEVNVDGFVNVALAARDAGCEVIVYASSSSVYGDHPDLPKREEATGEPLSPYAASKQMNEIYAGVLARCYGMRIVGLRYFNVIGPRQDLRGPYAAVVPRWLAAFAAGEQPVIYGDGSASRDFCPVANVVEANLLAAYAPESASGRVYNVALGGRTTLTELFAMLRKAMARSGAPCRNTTARFMPPRKGDIPHSHADISRAENELGYAPRVDLQDGLERAVGWNWRHA